MHSLLAFLLALGILVAVHEYGHYKVAVLCGVRVLRFSLGFGPVLYRRPFGPAFALAPVLEQTALGFEDAPPSPQVQRSEFVLSLIPLGGYVTFWDESQVKAQGILQPLSEAARACLFESQSLLKRSAIVLAGPLANLLLCVLLTWMMYLWGVEQDAPVLASPVAGSVAERWGFSAGSRVLSFGLKGQEPTKAQSLQDFERFVQMALESHHDAQVWVQTSTVSNGSSVTRRLELPLSTQAQTLAWDALGLQGPYRAPIIESVGEGSAGALAGLKRRDRVVSVDGLPVADAADLRGRIAHSLHEDQVQAMQWRIEREAAPQSPWESNSTRQLQREGLGEGLGEGPGERLGERLGERPVAGARQRDRELKEEPNVDPRMELLDVVVLAAKHEDRPGVVTARVGIYLGGPPERLTVRYDPWIALQRAFSTTGAWIWQTLQALGQLFGSSKGWSDLGGPLTLAKYAGESAGLGVAAFLAYLGLVSVNLGVFNLLPIPVLDGGHLLSYAWQALTGRAINASLWGSIQRVGLVLLLLLTLLALRNDIARWLAG